MKKTPIMQALKNFQKQGYVDEPYQVYGVNWIFVHTKYNITSHFLARKINEELGVDISDSSLVMKIDTKDIQGFMAKTFWQWINVYNKSDDLESGEEDKEEANETDDSTDDNTDDGSNDDTNDSGEQKE